MHKLFPDKFPADDPYGKSCEDGVWFLQNVNDYGPSEVYKIEADGESCILHFETPYHAGVSLLEVLHKQTGWTLVDRYVADFEEFKGVAICQNGSISDRFEYSEGAGPQGAISACFTQDLPF